MGRYDPLDKEAWSGKIGLMVEYITETVTKLIQLLGIDATASVTEEAGDDAQKIVKVVIDSKEESGLLIGAHGQTLEALESFLSLALRTKYGEWTKVLVDVAQWREKQTENLVALGKQAAARAISTGESQYLYNLTPSQRREIHLSLKNEEGIETLSEGDGEDRFLIIKQK